MFLDVHQDQVSLTVIHCSLLELLGSSEPLGVTPRTAGRGVQARH